MFSKYKYKIRIDRNMTQEELELILRLLEHGTILQFGLPKHLDRFPNDIRIIIDACGYICRNECWKFVKLTNIQRIEFIKQAKYALSGNNTHIIIKSNEYIDSLLYIDY